MIFLTIALIAVGSYIAVTTVGLYMVHRSTRPDGPLNNRS